MKDANDGFCTLFFTEKSSEAPFFALGMRDTRTFGSVSLLLKSSLGRGCLVELWGREFSRRKGHLQSKKGGGVPIKKRDLNLVGWESTVEYASVEPCMCVSDALVGQSLGGNLTIQHPMDARSKCTRKR